VLFWQKIGGVGSVVLRGHLPLLLWVYFFVLFGLMNFDLSAYSGFALLAILA
jgi:hypothetical protein